MLLLSLSSSSWVVVVVVVVLVLVVVVVVVVVVLVVVAVVVVGPCSPHRNVMSTQVAHILADVGHSLAQVVPILALCRPM